MTAYGSGQTEQLRAEIARRPRDFSLYAKLAGLLEASRDVDGAVAALRAGIAVAGAPAALWCALARIAQRKGDIEGARRIIDDGLRRHRASLELYAEQVSLFQNDPVAVLDIYRRAAAACGESAVLMHNMGCTFQALDRLDEAERCFRRALSRNEMLFESWNNLGLVLRDQGRIPEALKIWAQGIARAGAHAMSPQTTANVPEALVKIRWHRASTWLLLEDFDHGWPEYEWRFRGSGEWIPAHPAQRWAGEPASGARILVFGEQGIGDEILFASMLPAMLKGGADIVVACEPRLAALFRRAWPRIEVHAYDRTMRAPLPGPCMQVAMQLPIGSLPGLLWATRPVGGAPYLRVDDDAAQRWRMRHDAAGAGLRVGLSWRGGTARTSAARSIAIRELATLGNLPGLHLIDVQYGSTPQERAEFARGGPDLAHFDETDPLQDMDDFAAQLSTLDLLVSVDNSTVHLAGALGVPTWVLQPKVPEWRWGLDRTDCLWYASVRQFRQTRRGDWSDVIGEVAKALKVLTGEKPGAG